MKYLLLLTLVSCGQILDKGLDSMDKQTRQVTHEVVSDKINYCSEAHLQDPCDTYCMEDFNTCIEI